jgi:hypothetical protein
MSIAIFSLRLEGARRRDNCFCRSGLPLEFAGAGSPHCRKWPRRYFCRPTAVSRFCRAWNRARAQSISRRPPGRYQLYISEQLPRALAIREIEAGEELDLNVVVAELPRISGNVICDCDQPLGKQKLHLVVFNPPTGYYVKEPPTFNLVPGAPLSIQIVLSDKDVTPAGMVLTGAARTLAVAALWPIQMAADGYPE